MWTDLCQRLGMNYSYHLLSSCGIDLIIIPELDCRIDIIDPIKNDINIQRGEQIVFATVLSRELAFQVVGKILNDPEHILNAIRWYSFQKTFIKQVA